MKPFSRDTLLRLVIEVFYNKCSSIFVHNWLILIRDTIMCKKKKVKIKANNCGCSMIVIIMPNTLCMEKEYLYICAFNNNSAILTLQF